MLAAGGDTRGRGRTTSCPIYAPGGYRGQGYIGWDCTGWGIDASILSPIAALLAVAGLIVVRRIVVCTALWIVVLEDLGHSFGSASQLVGGPVDSCLRKEPAMERGREVASYSPAYFLLHQRLLYVLAEGLTILLLTTHYCCMD